MAQHHFSMTQMIIYYFWLLIWSIAAAVACMNAWKVVNNWWWLKSNAFVDLHLLTAYYIFIILNHKIYSIFIYTPKICFERNYTFCWFFLFLVEISVRQWWKWKYRQMHIVFDQKCEFIWNNCWNIKRHQMQITIKYGGLNAQLIRL